MNQSLAHIALVVRDYDEAIGFYVGTLGFELVEDTYQPEQDKRWVIVKPKGSGTASLLLALARPGFKLWSHCSQRLPFRIATCHKPGKTSFRAQASTP